MLQPANIVAVKLSEVAAINPRLEAKLSADEAVSFVPMAALSSISAEVIAEEIRPYAAVAKGYTPFMANDVLVAKITPCFENNKIGQANLSRPVGFGSTEFHVIRPHKGRADARYLMHYLRQDHVRAEGERKMTGSAGQRRVPEHYFAGLDLPLPSLHEQRRIAAILDQADALRAKRRAALAQIDELEQAIFEQTFLTTSWPEVSVEAIARAIRTGPFGSQLLHSEFVDDGIAVLGIDNAVHNDFRWDERRFIAAKKYVQLSRYRVYPRDIIITIMGTCGRAAIVPDDIPLAITTKHLCSITLDETRCLPEYLHACLVRHPAILRQLGVTARGAVMPGLNMGIIRETRLSLPPIEIQAEFARLQREIRQSQVASEQSGGTMDTLFASLQHRAFRGEL